MKKYFALLLVSIFTFLNLEIAHASHITGGEMTYVCNATGSYDVTMILYRDCGGISLPADAVLNIYRHDNGDLTTISTTLLSSNFIFDDFDDPCATIPAGNCVEKGIYLFEDVEIPLSTLGFIEIYYQTTALSDDYIGNVLNAGIYGITVNALIPPLTTSTCHDSPTFDSDPPLILCLTLPLAIDLSVTTSNTANTVVYEYYTPYTNSPTTPLVWDITTNDFDTVVWDIGYTSEDPFGTASGTNMTVSTTGFIQGVVNQTNHYYAGVKVKEYDSNGNLISVIGRTFTYITVDCNITTSVIDLAEDEACGELTIDFLQGGSGGIDYYWEFGDPTSSDNSSINENATHTFTGFGDYTIMLISFTDDIACADTAYRDITLYDALPATIEPNGPQCLATNSFDFESTFENNTGYPVTVLWEFGPIASQATSTDYNPSDISYSATGNHSVTLHVYYLDCETIITTTVNVFDGLLDQIAGPTYACDPETVTFQGATSNPDYEYTWYIGDDTLTGSSVEYYFDEPGYYDVSLYIFDPENGCESLQEISDYIQVFPTPIAGFSVSDLEFTVGEQFQMLDESDKATSITYSIVTDGFVSNLPNPYYVFTTTGDHIITQSVLNGQCQDSETITISVSPREPFIPNVFSPNGDFRNDYFSMDTHFNENVQVDIYDRWGNKMFSSDQYELCNSETGEECWDGTNQTNGNKCKKGTYFYVVKLKTGESYKGTVNIF